MSDYTDHRPTHTQHRAVFKGGRKTIKEPADNTQVQYPVGRTVTINGITMRVADEGTTVWNGLVGITTYKCELVKG